MPYGMPGRARTELLGDAGERCLVREQSNAIRRRIDLGDVGFTGIEISGHPCRIRVVGTGQRYLRPIERHQPELRTDIPLDGQKELLERVRARQEYGDVLMRAALARSEAKLPEVRG